MSYQRVVRRNHLVGDYASSKLITVNVDNFPDLDPDDIARMMHPHYVEAIKGANARWSMLQGDLRRLEDNATDENAICTYIANRTSLDPDTVAVVLKEFLTW